MALPQTDVSLQRLRTSPGGVSKQTPRRVSGFSVTIERRWTSLLYEPQQD